MATVTAPQPARLPARSIESALRIPAWLERIPHLAVAVAGVLVVLMAISAFLRTRYLGGQYWMDEAISVGIASHPLSAIPGVLRHDGSPPLYYMLLHVWMSAFGSSEPPPTRCRCCSGCSPSRSALAGWSLFGRRAGIIAAVLFAFTPFLTAYARRRGCTR